MICTQRPKRSFRKWLSQEPPVESSFGASRGPRLLRVDRTISEKVSDLFGNSSDRIFHIWSDAVMARCKYRDHNVSVGAFQYPDVISDIRKKVASFVRHPETGNVLGQ